jgi:hypothetical protein
VGVAHEPHGLTRRAETDLHLRAHGHPREAGAEEVDDDDVPLVAAVVAHALAEETGRDADADHRAR